MTRLVATPVEAGPFYLGDTGPPIKTILTYDTGGYVDLTDAPGITFSVQRWDPIKRERYGDMVTGGDCTFGELKRGEAIYDWATSPLPTNPGWYAGQFAVTMSDGTVRHSQEMVFEVRKPAPTPP